MPVEMTNRQTSPVPLALIRQLAQRALKTLGAAEAELSVALVDDAQMRALNRQYRRLDRTTDVLAFPTTPRGWRPEGPESRARRPRETTPPILLGDVVISVETAIRRVGGRRLPEELGRYLLHGILHLMGWDHHTLPERRAMRRRERQLWSAVWSGEIS